MIDFHAHILPACDHGSDGLSTSLKQLEMARQAGISTIIATPHFYPQKERLDDFLARRERTYQELIQHHQQTPEILVGAEVNLCSGLDHMQGLSQTCVSGTNIILIELPMLYWSQSFEETLLRLHDDSGLTLVLAHIDRYDVKIIDRLMEYGMLAQLNVDSLIHRFGTRKLLQWIDDGNVVALGSDIHGVKTGYTNFQRALHLLKDRADIVFSRTEKLLNDNAL